jgi:hypothetical protein
LKCIGFLGDWGFRGQNFEAMHAAIKQLEKHQPYLRHFQWKSKVDQGDL